MPHEIWSAEEVNNIQVDKLTTAKVDVCRWSPRQSTTAVGASQEGASRMQPMRVIHM